MKPGFLVFAAGVAAIATANSASAQPFGDWTPDTARILSDPTYLPLAGQIYGMTEFGYGFGGADLSSLGGAPLATTSQRTAIFTQRLAYGITDEFSVHAGASYDFRRNEVSPQGGSPFTLNSNGFADPSFGATFRVLDQRLYPVDLDLSLDYAPDIVANNAPSRTSNGSVASGDHQIAASVAVGREWRSFTAQGVFRLIYNTGPQINEQANGTVLNENANWQYFLGLNTQTRFTPRLSLNTDFGYSILQSRGASVSPIGVDRTIDPGNQLALDVALNYHLIPNQLVGSLTYSHVFFGDGTTTLATVPVSGTQLGNHDEDIFGVRLQYSF